MRKKEPPKIVRIGQSNPDGTVSCTIDDLPWRLSPKKIKRIRDLAEKPEPDWQRYIVR